MNELPLTHKEACALYQAIRALPHSRIIKCPKCNHSTECSNLQIQFSCPKCNQQVKLRSFSAATEIQDLLLVVLKWYSETGLNIPSDLLPYIKGDWSDWDDWFTIASKEEK